jgi:CRP-like cAMP-binding protein
MQGLELGTENEGASMRQEGNRFLDALGADLEILRPHLTEVTLRAGQVLAEPEDEIRYVYFLHGGAVSKLSSFADGSEIEAALIGREGAVGVIAALGLTCSITRDICHVEARASRIPADRLRAACLASPRLHALADRYVLWKMAVAIRSGACNARHSVSQRLCRWILTCCDVLETREIALPQDVFAKMLGVQRTSINPILQDLKAAGALATGRSRIVINDPDVLLARTCECHAAMKRDQEAMMRDIFAQSAPPAPVADRDLTTSS